MTSATPIPEAANKKEEPVNGNVVKEPVEKKSQKKKSKGKKAPPSPEEIARIRAERASAREAKEKAALAQGIDPDLPKELSFIKRPMLKLHEEEPVKGFRFKIMTYNCLAQALIRRKLFPDGGNALKWFRRSKVLLNEFKYYNPDVICLQEVDFVQFQSFWNKEFSALGYECQFFRKPSKNHGISIIWRRELFEMSDRMLIDYDQVQSGDIPPRTTTNNVGLILALKFTEKALKNLHANSERYGILIGTTHLFWHPFGTYERTRQCYVLLNKMKEFMHRVNVLQNNADGKPSSHWFPFICGDFNAQPFDTPYLSMTSKPVTYSGRAKTVLECSTSFKFSKLRDGEEGDEEEGGNIEKFGKDQPQHPVPDSFIANDEQLELSKRMEKLHNSLDMRAISLYSVGYSQVHPENSGLDNNRGEPEISNWAHVWRGLLDYLFFIKHWDLADETTKTVDNFTDFEKSNGLKIRGFLRMPPGIELTIHGQPHEGEYASDHLSMMVDIELNM